jgi:hypothetical protein
VGTPVEWILVLVRGAFFGGFMFLVPRWLHVAPFGKNMNREIAGAISSGLLFGLIATFGLRLLRFPLLILTIAFAVGIISISLLLRRQRQA